MKWLYRMITVLAAMSLALIGCAPDLSESIEGRGETSAAYTMPAVLTQFAFQTLEAQLTEVSRVTPTPQELTKTPTITATGGMPPSFRKGLSLPPVTVTWRVS